MADWEQLRVFVCADLHAFSSQVLKANAKPGVSHRENPSFYDVNGPAENCPVRQLLDYTRDKDIKADLLLCAGDLCDSASKEGLEHSWNSLNSLQGILGASKLIATVGNHDLDSRFVSGTYDPKESIQQLQPLFPVVEETTCDQFWSRHFCFQEGPFWRVCIINSAAYHGFNGEHKRGRIAKVTLNKIISYLDSAEEKPINIVLCHHPPHDQSENHQGSGDQIHHGDDLIEYLGSGKYGIWTIIFGHKHFPKLEYARGSDSAPILLSSAPLSASPYNQYGFDATNQFHIIEFERIATVSFCGAFRLFSHQWIPGAGWHEATYERGLPPITGIGFRTNVQFATDAIEKVIADTDEIEWSSIIDNVPWLSYVPIKSIYSIVRFISDHKGYAPEFAGLPYRSKLIKLVKK